MSFKKNKTFSARLVAVVLIELALIATSLEGLQIARYSSPGQFLVPLILFALVPLFAFAYIAMREVAGSAEQSQSVGFQHRIDTLQKRLNAQDDLFDAINRYSPSSVMIFGEGNTFWFANPAAAQALGVEEREIVGKTPIEILGTERGGKILQDVAKALQSEGVVEIFDRFTDKQGTRQFMQTRYQKISSFGEFPGGVMAHSENITTVVTERETRETMLRQLISTLVAVVDRRDPYASGHSSRVGQLSRILAADMKLSDAEIETAEIAGSLMNFGKVLVSRDILTKAEPLTLEELQRVRDGILTSADILSRINFPTPIVPTLRQVLERFDGTGVPNHLAGDAILTTAQIVAVANAFVAMVSPRAYRAGTDFNVAVERLANDAGKVFDPRVIDSLKSYITKNVGRQEWLTTSKTAF